jgi:hypothetical protein
LATPLRISGPIKLIVSVSFQENSYAGRRRAMENVADVVRGLLPVMEKMHIATASEVQPEMLVDRIRDEVVAKRGVVTSPGIIGAWARKPS